MKYTNEITINLSIDSVIELFDNPENMKYWQKGFVSMEHISGDQGKSGAKSQLKYLMGKRSIEMIETIIENNLPNIFHSTYETKGVINIQKKLLQRGREQDTVGFRIRISILWIYEAYGYIHGFKAI